MKKSKKFYTVWEGRKPGIYLHWYDCEAQVKGYPGARFAGFDTYEEAEFALKTGPEILLARKRSNPTINAVELPEPVKIEPGLAVDAACSGNPGVMEYRGVLTESGQEVFRQGPFEHATNNIGEFLGIVHGLAWLMQINSTIPVYSDSGTAIIWVRNKKVNTKLTRTAQNEQVFGLIERAVSWLHQHEYPNQLIKWDTRKWGEIPADFGRK